MLGGEGLWGSENWCRIRCNGEGLTTGPAKLSVRRHASPTGRAGLFELCAALLAEADLFAVLETVAGFDSLGPWFTCRLLSDFGIYY